MTDHGLDPQPPDPRRTETVTSDTGPIPSRIPERIGRYHIKRIIASGGMGTVYEATQDNPRRVVAVKVMKQGIASKSALRRFEYEGQILGRLRHPGIAQIYEAGTHVDREGIHGPAGAPGAAVPYFAMEYIPNAKTITKFAEDKKLGTRQRMELFAKVCDAIHHGHQKGIIHRDLKPSNILVDSTGQVKIIDFGVARSTDSDMAVTTLQTDVGQLIGTLQYMSPEQCEGDPHDIDTRSDVYALGMVFYQLLCGKLPYDVTRMAMHQATRAIREQHPTKLSTLDRTLRGDVETIALKALEKERERRYQSAADLGHDIDRYLTGEAITARRASIVYQLRLFARRNKGVFASLAAVFIVLVAGIIVSTSLYLRAETARQHAILAEQEQSRERALAEQARIEAEGVTTFLSDMLAAVDPRQAGKDVSVRQVLDQASKSISEKFTDNPLVEARLRQTIGTSYYGLGVYDEAERHLPVAVEMYRRLLGEEHVETIRSMNALTNLYLRLSRVDEARALNERTVEQARKGLGEGNAETLRALHLKGNLMGGLGRPEEQITLCKYVLEQRRRTLGEEHLDTLNTMNALAIMYLGTGLTNQGASLLEQTVAIKRRVFGDEHPDTQLAMIKLASTYSELCRSQEAVTLGERVLATFRRVLGDEHPNVVFILDSLAQILDRQGNYSEAERLFREALAMRRKLLGDEHPHVLYNLDVIAGVLKRQGNYPEAERLYREALAMRRKLLGEEHPDVAHSLNAIAGVLDRQGNYPEAERLLREALAMRRKLLGEEHKDTLFATNNVAWRMLTSEAKELRNPEAALGFAQRTCELAEKVGDRNLYQFLDTLALAQHMTGDTGTAFQTQQRALTLTPEGDRFRKEMEERLATYQAAQAKLTAPEPSPP